MLVYHSKWVILSEKEQQLKESAIWLMSSLMEEMEQWGVIAVFLCDLSHWEHPLQLQKWMLFKPKLRVKEIANWAGIVSAQKGSPLASIQGCLIHLGA